ncbi:hypothetical protein ABZ920_27070 [Streptomyces sp. NPDC046831]|uniref:hypothetical protein n=1 Tax=Streptomyces sp. NPDC046831 TaxID=3154805 RepID=UPI0033FE7D50
MIYALRGACLVVAAAAVAGCSSDDPKREFAAPESLCEVSVPADALSSLLPSSGKRVSVASESMSADGEGLCEVTVDDDTVLILSRERIDVGQSAESILRNRLSLHDPKSAEDGSVAYADRGAVSLIECRGTGVEEEDISTLIKVLEPARKDESAMKDLIVGYTDALRAQKPCRQGS